MSEAKTVGQIVVQSAPRGQRRGATVKRLGDELNRAVEVRRALQQYDDPQLILDMIEGSTDLPEMIYALYEETLDDETLGKGIDAKIEELKERKSRIEHSIETRRNIILMAMEKAALDTIKGPLATLSVRDVPPKTVIVAEAEIPARFWKPQDPALDKRALADALKSGEQVPGASLSNGGIGLSIRVK